MESSCLVGKGRDLALQELCTNRKILFLDEATNALDSKTESHILNNAKEQTNTTIFSITHRLSTTSNYDFVIRVSSNHVSVDKV